MKYYLILRGPNGERLKYWALPEDKITAYIVQIADEIEATVDENDD